MQYLFYRRLCATIHRGHGDKKTIEKRKTVKEAKKADPRKIELVCLKNRYGVSSYSAYFDYFPRYDLYVETLEPPEPIAAPNPKRTSTRKSKRNKAEEYDGIDELEPEDDDILRL